jgi:hypothetical protein
VAVGVVSGHFVAQEDWPSPLTLAERNRLARELADVRDELDAAGRRVAELADDLGDRTAERDQLAMWAQWLWKHATPDQKHAARAALGHLPELLDGTLYAAMAAGVGE